MNPDTEQELKDIVTKQFDIKTKLQADVLEVERRIAINGNTAADKAELAILRGKLTATDNAIGDLNKQRADYIATDKSEKMSATKVEECKIVDQLIEKYNIGYLPAENDYVYCIGMEETNSNLVNPIFTQIDGSKFGRVLMKMAGKQLRLGYKTYAFELADHFQLKKKDYYTTTASFNSQKWGKEKAYNKAGIIRKYWVQPLEGDYDPRFDFLIHCIGGGKQENMDHLEQWIAYKYLYPERVGNTPNLDIGGFPGGNGKGRYIELCKTIFTNPCVIAAALKELMDGFNGTWEMATLLYYDEPAANELPEGKLKQATGGEDMRSEKKGIDAKIVDRNYSILFVSNNINGVVKLAGTGSGGEDRRYSVMITDKVMVDEAINQGLAKTIEESKVYVNGINELIKDRKEVGKWLNFIIKIHQVEQMSILGPLHGIDYQARFEGQKKELDVAFDQILSVYLKNKCIPTKILWELVKALTGYEKLKQTKCTQEFERFLSKNKIAHILDKQKVKHMYGTDEVFTLSLIHI